MSLKPRAWKNITWREGSNAPLTGRFAAVRVRPAHRDQKLSEPRARANGCSSNGRKVKPSRPSTGSPPCPATTKLADLVAMTKQRWRIERDYQDLKQEIGLGHYEGRGWRGFHHHAHTLHRGLRVSDLRKGDDSPLWTRLAHQMQSDWHSQGLPTQRLSRSVPNVTSPIQSQP